MKGRTPTAGIGKDYKVQDRGYFLSLLPSKAAKDRVLWRIYAQELQSL